MCGMNVLKKLRARWSSTNPDDEAKRRKAADRERKEAFLEALDDSTYLQAYSADSDNRIRQDPAAGIGGLWDEMGEKQLAFLRKEGLRIEHKLLDVGCGTLRAGRLFIGFLAPGNYTGFDLSKEAINQAERLVRVEGLSDKQPLLLHNPSGALDFSILDGARFNFLLAQSVFSHLRESHIDQCFANLHRVMAPGAKFFFTYLPSERAKPRRGKNICHSEATIRDISARHGFTLRIHPEYEHPREQEMMEAFVEG